MKTDKDMFEENDRSEMKITQNPVKFTDHGIDDSLVDFSSDKALDFAVKSFKEMTDKEGS